MASWRLVAEGNEKFKYVAIGCGIALLLGVCGVGSCFALAGGGAFFAYKEMEAPLQVTQQFLTAVREDRPEDAYAHMAPSYRESHSLEDFRARLDALPALKAHQQAELPQRMVHTEGAEIAGGLTTPQGDVPVHAFLEEQDEQWYVRALEVGGQQL